MLEANINVLWKNPNLQITKDVNLLIINREIKINYIYIQSNSYKSGQGTLIFFFLSFIEKAYEIASSWAPPVVGPSFEIVKS